MRMSAVEPVLRIATWALLAVTHLTLTVIVAGEAEGGWFAAMLRDTLPLSQSALLIALLIAGRGWPIKLAALLVGIIWLTLSPFQAFDDVSYGYLWTRVATVHAIALTLAFLVARIGRFRIERPASLKLNRLQFSIRALLLATTGLAIAMFAAQELRHRISLEEAAWIADRYVQWLVASVFTATSLMATVLMLRAMSGWLASAMLNAFAFVAGLFLTYALNFEGGPAVVAWPMAHAALLGGSLLILRSTGYRFVRPQGPFWFVAFGRRLWSEYLECREIDRITSA